MDVIIIGAGPAGLSAALTAKENNLSYIVLERGKIANTFIEAYPKGKLVLTYPKDLELKGELWFKEAVTEEVIKRWNEISKENKINIKECEEVIDIKKEGDFKVVTNKNTYEGENVILAIGKEGNPRKLCVKGEESKKVFYKLKDPENFKGKNILVVGGGDNAVEIVLALSENNNVTLSYRRDAFFRLKEDNLKKINESKKVEIIFKSNLKEIKNNLVILDVDGTKKELKNDFVFIFAGTDLPVDFLTEIGVNIKDGKAVINENYETNINGLYAIGDISGKPLIKYAINQGYEVIKWITNKNL